MTDTPHTFAICVNRRLGSDKASCAARGSEQIADALEAGVRERGLAVEIERIVCFGQCQVGPNGRLIPGGNFHKGMTIEDVPALLDEIERACGKKSPGEGNSIPAPGT